MSRGEGIKAALIAGRKSPLISVFGGSWVCDQRLLAIAYMRNYSQETMPQSLIVPQSGSNYGCFLCIAELIDGD